MIKIAFMSQKGGSGKSTLAVHTAVAASEGGHKVVLIDTDPQHSASRWGRARSDHMPTVATVSASDLPHALELAEKEGMAFCIIDTPPHASPETAKIARSADFILIPCRPSAFDLGAINSSFNIVNASGVKGAFVLSACPFRAPEIGETKDVLAAYAMAICPVEITDRRAFSRALSSGRAVTEFESDGRAAGEIRNLWNWIKETVQ